MCKWLLNGDADGVAMTLKRELRAADGTHRVGADMHDNLGAEGQFADGGLRNRGKCP